MKRLILLFCIVALFEPVFCNEKQKDSITIGYHVVIQKNGKFQKPLNTESLAEVYAYINVYFPDFCADIETELKKSPVFIQETFKNQIYVEKKRITKTGKYKRIKNFTKFENNLKH